MRRAARASIADALTVPVVLDEIQAREFSACAKACGLSIEDWILDCARVKAAQVIDAIQATARRARATTRVDNEPNNARDRERRRVARRAA